MLLRRFLNVFLCFNWSSSLRRWYRRFCYFHLNKFFVENSMYHVYNLTVLLSHYFLWSFSMNSFMMLQYKINCALFSFFLIIVAFIVFSSTTKSYVILISFFFDNKFFRMRFIIVLTTLIDRLILMLMIKFYNKFSK